MGSHPGLETSRPGTILELEERSKWKEFTTSCNKENIHGLKQSQRW